MARLTRDGRITPHRPGFDEHEFDELDELDELDGVDDGMRYSAPETYLDDGTPGDPYVDSTDRDGTGPLRFDKPVPTTGGSSREYVAPRPSRWRMLRWPLLVTAIVAALLAATWTAWAPVLDGIAEGASTLAAREGDGRTRMSVTIGLAALALLSFIGVWWKNSHPRRAVRLADGRGTIAVDAIAGQLRAAIFALPEVRAAEVAVENRGGGQVRVRTWLAVTAEARIDDALDGVDAAADWLVHHRLGLMFSEPPLAEVRYDELDLRAARASSGGRVVERPDGERDD